MATTLTALTVGAAPVSAKPGGGGDAGSPTTTTAAPRPPKQDSSAEDGSGGGGYGQSQDGGQRGRKQRNQTPDADVPPVDVPAVRPQPPADPPAVSSVAPVAPEITTPASKAPAKTPEAPAPVVETPSSVVVAPPSSTDVLAPTTKVTKAQPSETSAEQTTPATPARPSTVVAEPSPTTATAPAVTSVTQSPTTAIAEHPSAGGAVQPDPSTAPTDHAVADGKPTAGSEGQAGDHGSVELGAGRVDASEAASATVTAGSPKSASPSTSGDRPAVREARQIETLKPETLTAPVADVEVAKAAAAVDVKLPEPAPVHDVADLAQVVNVANFQHDNRADWDRRDNRDNRPDWDRRDNRPMGRDWDNRVRQWQPDWVQYDDYYRPVMFNPYRDPVRVVYMYRNAPRIVYIPPLQRIVMEVVDLAAYSFTAVVVNAVNTAVNVAVGSFFGGGYYPGIGMPLPPPPPPVLSYANVPVQVRYSDAVYQPFRVQRIVDAGDDVQYGERRVLLDGVTPAWGQWTQSPSGERQFEVHRTQQFPGLDEPREAPLPGDYRLQLVNDQKGLDSPNKALTIAAVTCGLLSLGAIGLSVYIGRRRREVDVL
ncbi:hypothetical protein BOO86_12070 [Mycobacterium sp. CBMA 234]|nr:hypothetical protein [Mycolicibacterium sp. CBMA 234]